MSGEQDKEFTNNDFIMTINQDGGYIGGGFSLDSQLLRNHKSPMHTMNLGYHDNNDNNDFSSLFENLAVPAIYYIRPEININIINEIENNDENNDCNNEHNMLGDDIYDELFSLIEFEKQHNNNKTKKYNNKNNKNKNRTKRNKQ